MEVTVKKLRKLLIVGVASVAKCWRQNPQISLSRGVVLPQSTFHLVLQCDYVKLVFDLFISEMVRELRDMGNIRWAFWSFIRSPPTMSAKALCFRAVRPPCAFGHINVTTIDLSHERLEQS